MARDKEKQRAWNARDYQAHKEEVKARGAAWYKANPEKAKASRAVWAKAHKEEKKACQAARYKTHPEKVKARSAAWYKANSEEAKTHSAAWRKAHREKAKAYSAAWAKAHPEAGKLHKHTRRARKAAVGVTLSKSISEKLLLRQKGKCAICKKSVKKSGYHLDHIMPLALGGKNEDGNIQILCPTCNLQKNSRHPITHMQSLGYLL